jgi:hypothetical protein
MIANMDEAYLLLSDIRDLLTEEIAFMESTYADGPFLESLQILFSAMETAIIKYELAGEGDSGALKEIQEVADALACSPLYRQKLRKAPSLTYESLKQKLDAIASAA